MDTLIAATNLDLPNWAGWAFGVVATLLISVLWFNADQRYVRRTEHEKETQKLEAKIAKLEKDSEERHKSITETQNQQYEALRKTIHDRMGDTHNMILKLVETVAEMRGQLAARNP